MSTMEVEGEEEHSVANLAAASSETCSRLSISV